MSTQANVLHDAQVSVKADVFTPISTLQLFSWSVRRELWEHRSLYLAPAIVAALVLLGFFFTTFGMLNISYNGSPEGTHGGIPATGPYDLVTSLITITALLVGIFYTADALYAERRDRSILFWKSLPVSDLMTVLAKASMPLLVLPFIVFVITVTTHLVMALASSAVLLRTGDPVGPLWSQLALPQMWVWLFGHLFTVTALWYAPFYAWLLLVSAWSTRTPLLWAFLPPIALSALEAIVFHTSHISKALSARLVHGSMTAAALTRNPVDRLHLLSIGLSSPELWLGLLAAAVMFAGSVQLRRYRSTL